MLPNVNPEKLIEQSRQYEFLDGLRDIQLGLYFLFFGPIVWIGTHPAWLRFIILVKERAGDFSEVALFILFLGVYFLALFFSQVFINWLRKRWLWINTGIAKPKRNIFPVWYSIVLTGLLLCLLFFGVWLQVQVNLYEFFLWNYLYAMTGWLMGLSFWLMGNFINISRYKVLGIIGTALSTFLLLPEIGFRFVPLFYGLLFGLLLIIPGAYALNSTVQELKEVRNEQ